MALSDIRTALSDSPVSGDEVAAGVAWEERRSIRWFSILPVLSVWASGRLADQQQNEDGWRFSIDIIQEINVKNVDAAEADFQDAIEEVKHKLNTEWLLRNGSNVPTVQFSMIDMTHDDAGVQLGHKLRHHHQSAREGALQLAVAALL